MEILHDDGDYDDPHEIPWRSRAWRRHAKCAGVDTETYYPARNRDTYKTIADGSKGVCKGHDGWPECPVRSQCLTYALTTNEAHGIWGGLSHRERNALLKKWDSVGRPSPLSAFVSDYMHAYKA